MKRPLFFALLFLVLGIITGQYADTAFVLFFVLICVLNLFVYLLYKRIEYAIIFSLLFVLGFINIKHSLSGAGVTDNYVGNGSMLKINGIVLDLSTTSTGRLKLIIRVFHIDNGYNAVDCDMKIQAIIDADNELSISQAVTLQGKLEFPDLRRNPGGFDEHQYLRSRQILYKTYAVLLKKGDIAFRLENYTAILKNRLAHVYDKVLPPREAGIMKSMIIGDREGLEDDLSELYRVVGLFHILSISGLHVSIFGMLLDMLLGRLMGRRASGILTILILVLYCIMTGCAVSSVRSVIMSSILISSRLLNRSSDLVLSTSFSAICLLLYQPLYLWDIGFQYSYLAVYGIAFFTKPIEYGIRFLRQKNKAANLILGLKYINSCFPATLAATIATTPVMLYHFYYFTTYAVIVNMLVVPSAFIVLMSGICSGLIGLALPEISVLMSGIPYYILRAYEWVASSFAALPFSTILIGKTTLWVCAYWYFTAACFGYLLLNIGKKTLFNKKYFASLIFVPLIAVCLHGLKPEILTVDMLDVGQGDSIVITKGNRTFLIDGGGSRLAEGAGGTGARVIKPYLDYRGINYIDAVFITHFDADHVKGVLEILELKKVGKVYIQDVGLIQKKEEETSYYYDNLLSTADKYKIPIETIFAGERIIAGDLIFECLNPYNGNAYTESNTASLVLRLIGDYASFLFTGDIDTAAEASIIKNAANISADVLKLSHHGSKYSNHDAFIGKVAPKAAIVGTGRGNLYGHPAGAVLDILRDRGITLYNTADCGMIRIESNKTEMTVEAYLNN